jgi:hypothetical protein
VIDPPGEGLPSYGPFTMMPSCAIHGLGEEKKRPGESSELLKVSKLTYFVSKPLTNFVDSTILSEGLISNGL